MKADGSIMVRCQTTDTIFAVDRWRHRDPRDGQIETDIELYTRVGKPYLGYRLKTAWRVLTGRDHYLDLMSVSVDDARRLGRFLLEVE